MLKRSIDGTFHNVSRKHLHRYVAEFDFRWNAPKVDDGERLARAIKVQSASDCAIINHCRRFRRHQYRGRHFEACEETKTESG
jgi:hypothetical protein